jgi:hypothetical protein
VFERIKKLFRKEPAMAEENKAAVNPPAFDAAAFEAKMLGALEAGLKPIAAEIGKLQAAAKPAEQAAARAIEGVALKAEDVGRIIEEKLSAFSNKQSTASAREAFATSKMADLPAIYRSQLPQTADAAELARAEQTIRAQYQADFKASGGKTENVAGTTPANAQAATRVAVDTSKMTASQLLDEGLKQRPVAAAVPATAETAALAK